MLLTSHSSLKRLFSASVMSDLTHTHTHTHTHLNIITGDIQPKTNSNSNPSPDPIRPRNSREHPNNSMSHAIKHFANRRRLIGMLPVRRRKSGSKWKEKGNKRLDRGYCCTWRHPTCSIEAAGAKRRTTTTKRPAATTLVILPNSNRFSKPSKTTDVLIVRKQI